MFVLNVQVVLRAFCADDFGAALLGDGGAFQGPLDISESRICAFGSYSLLRYSYTYPKVRPEI